MGVTGRSDSCGASGRPWVNPSGHLRSFCRAAFVLLALLVVTLGAWAGRAEAAEYCFFPDAPPTTFNASLCNTEITWPTVWYAIDSLMTETAEAGYATGFNLIRDSTHPGMYVAKKTMSAGQGGQTFLFFRMRTNGATVSATDGTPYTSLKTAFWMITTTTNPAYPRPTFALSWDMQGVENHGLEMTYQSATYGTPALWSQTNFSDVDGNSGNRRTNDIDGVGANWAAQKTGKEGYVRVVDGQPFTSGTSNFIDIAVSCAYFSRVAGQANIGTFNPCTQSFYSSAAVSSAINDNQGWTNEAATLDIFGIENFADFPNIGAEVWGSTFNPTAAVVTTFQARAMQRGVEVTWDTGAEIGTAGFNLYRVEPGTGSWHQVNRHLVAALEDSPNGGRYVVVDQVASPHAESTYFLEEIEHGGTTRNYGPFTVRPTPSATGRAATRVGASGWTRERRSDDAGASRVASSPRDDDHPRTYAPAGKRARSNRSSSRIASSSGAARVVVATEGLQVLDSATLASSLGMTDAAARAAIRARRLSIVGPEGPVACEPTEDGRRLYFHGTPLHSTWADTSVYWLTRGECRGFEVVQGTRVRGIPPATTVFMDQARVEQDRFPMNLLFREPWEDFWLWTQFIASHPTLGAATYQLPMPGATGGTGMLTVNVQGETTTNTGRDHRVRLTLNGTLLGDTAWAGETAASASFTVPAGVIAASGTNEVRVEALRDEGLPYSVVGLDSFDVAWERRAKATGDQLRMPHGLAGDLVVDGFSASDIWVLDLGNPARPRRVGGAQTGMRDGASFVRFRPSSAAGPFLALRPVVAAVPAVEVVPARPSVKELGAKGADYLILTSERLAGAATVLAEFRAGTGMRALVVTVEQIYDEYNHGNPAPEAIHAFLSDAHRKWGKAPRFLVLAGSGTYDGRGIMGVDDNHVPPLLVMGTKGLGPSDVALADVDGDDGVPEFAVGRIPVSTEAELLAYVEKLKAYEQDSGAWAGRAFFLTDNPDDGGDFPADSRASIARLGGRLTVEQLDHVSDVAATRAKVLGILNDGVGLLHFFGHAAVDRLANEGLLTSTDVDTMTNGGRAPIALLMTCAAGRYAYPGYDSLAMRLTKRSGGGAIAVVAASTLEWEADSRVLSEGMLSALATGARSVGEAFVSGLAASRDAETPIGMRRTYVLFGDPAVRLKP